VDNSTTSLHWYLSLFLLAMIVQHLVSVVLLLPSLVPAQPVPQSADVEDVYDDSDYGDYDADSQAVTPAPGLADLLRTGSGLAQGILALLGEKVKFVNTLLADQELRERVGSSISTGVNLTGQIARVAVPLVGTVARQGPSLINTTRTLIDNLNNQDNQERLSQVAGAGTRVAQGLRTVASQTPQLIGQGSRLAGSLVKAANDTAPLIIEGIEEFTDQLPLIASFASAYAEVNAEQTQKVAQTFYTSLQCELQCRDQLDNDTKQECIKKFCKEEQEEEEDPV